MRRVGFQSFGAVAFQPYSSRRRQEVTDLLLRWKVIPEDEISFFVGSLDAGVYPEDPARTLGHLAHSFEEEHVLGVSLVEPALFMPDRWILRLLAVDPPEREKGLGSTLLRDAEAFARHEGGRYLGVELPWYADAEATGRFLKSRGYRAYSGMGLPKRYSMSRYFVRDL